jgi:predicted HicB family RNase H-like nuclease
MKVKYSIHIPKELLDKLRVKADKENRSVNNLITMILESEFK